MYPERYSKRKRNEQTNKNPHSYERQNESAYCNGVYDSLCLKLAFFEVYGEWQFFLKTFLKDTSEATYIMFVCVFMKLYCLS